MRLRKKLLAAVLTFVMALTVTIPSLATATEEPKTLDILFMHDMHSHLNPFTVMKDGEAVQVGGLSRMMTLVKQQYEKNPNTLFVDAGDYSMGTVVQSVFETDAAELRTLGAMGVDALTLGNHEYDFGPDGLARSLMTAKNSGDKVPAIVVSNIDMEATKAQAPSEKRDALLNAFEEYGVKEYIMLEKGGVNIAVLGIFGLDAVDCAPFSELVFKDPVVGARETVDKILANEDADIIVCVSHSGTSSNPETSEDELIAKAVPEIDVIVSGHTHSKHSEAIVHGTTYIGSADEYGRYLGSMSLTQNTDGSWKLDNYELLEITEDIPADEEMQATIDNYLAQIDVNYLSVYGFERTQVLAENDVEFCSAGSLGSKHEERNLGSIMADSYRYYVESLPDWDGNPVHVAAVPKGLVRETYPMGNITVEDVFNSFSLGIGEDGMAGYPLVSVYFTGEEIKLIAEIDASISPLMNYARLYTSGLQWTFNPNRLILSKAYDAHLVTLDGERTEIEKDKLYRVVADLYSLKLLSSVTDLSYGLLSIIPKDAEGNVIENFSDTIIHTEGREVKAWEAIANYMESFEDTDGDGIANVDSRYASYEGRKAVEDSKKLGDLLKQPNKFFFWIVGIVLVVVLLLVLIVVLIIRGAKKRAARKLVEKKERLRNKI
ncbi:MAG: bifunctional metallophosphatase/5'-nucleotidase [Lachnospiraceae bacterium]|nr:bifunctional metallophosphatase/5'-nucleotidase [Lachnospiraceae bacterium]